MSTGVESRRAPRRRSRGKGPRRSRKKGVRRALLLALSVGALSLGLLYALARWASRPASADTTLVFLEWPADASAEEGAALLARAGVTGDPFEFRVLLLLTRPFLKLEPGKHLLSRALTPAAVLRRLARLTSRERVRLLIPEGFNQFQIAARLERQQVCGAADFLEKARDPQLLRRHAVSAVDAEGYLFPATYELFADSLPEKVVDTLVGEGVERIRALVAAEATATERLEDAYGWGEHEILTLASIVEKESSLATEQPIIASVFFNRLDDETFRPKARLQSDPTAGYGCLVAPELASCRGYQGRIRPGMLRDPMNPYNTYKHPGLPPGPISNPGASAIIAVLRPVKTDFLFFVSTGDGRHKFTRNLQDHEAAFR